MQKQPHTLEECFPILDALLTDDAIADIRTASAERMFIHQIALHGWFSNNWLGETAPLHQWFSRRGMQSTREMTHSLLDAYQRYLQHNNHAMPAPGQAALHPFMPSTHNTSTRFASLI